MHHTRVRLNFNRSRLEFDPVSCSMIRRARAQTLFRAKVQGAAKRTFHRQNYKKNTLRGFIYPDYLRIFEQNTKIFDGIDGKLTILVWLWKN